MLKLALRVRTTVENLLFVMLFTMVALTFADVIGRRIFGKPIFGAHDITEHLMAIIVFCGLPLVTAAAGHLAVDLLDKVIQSNAMAWWRFLTALLITAILALVAVLFFHQAIEANATREVSQALNIQRAPLYAFMGVCCALASAAALITAFSGPLVDKDGEHASEAL